MAMNRTVAVEAKCLNNEGIHYINKGNYEEAMKLISKGLSLVKQVLLVQDRPTKTDSYNMNMDENETLPCEFLELDPEDPSAALIEASRGNKPFIFSSPIYVPSDVNQAVTLQNLGTLSFILLYNLALTHHLSAIDGQLCLKKLQKALSLYELAYTLQMTEDIELSMLQTMAIVNNLGQIHTALGNQDQSQSCFEHLLSTIMLLKDYGDRESVDSLDGFILNCMPLILVGEASAPAA
jgi:tetratricopeptide (TPR) repeat protein